MTIVTNDNVSKDSNQQSDAVSNNWFEIITKKNNYLIAADNEEDLRDWVDSIEWLIRQLPVNTKC